jgi:hypothetical protein
MSNSNVPEPDMDKLLKHVLKDDMPPEAEERMKRRFLSLECNLDRPDSLVAEDAWLWMHGAFRKGLLVSVSAVMLALGILMHLSESKSALAYSIEQLKVMQTISIKLNQAAFMDCSIMTPGNGDIRTSYHLLWRAGGHTRIERISADDTKTIWISDATVASPGSDNDSISLKALAADSKWQPAMEYRTPSLLVRNMERRYRLMEIKGIGGNRADEFQIIGRDNRQTVEITVDARTYLPKALRKFDPDSDRNNGERICRLEVRFLWNQPVPDDWFIPRKLPGKQSIDP